jgi:Flp pilus assembly protein TadD
MKKLIYLKFICVCFYSFCPNLVQAQTQPLPTTNLPVTNMPVPVQANPVAAPTTPGTARVPVPGELVTPNPALQTTPQTKDDGKYAEYQSYCRQNDFDDAVAFTKEQHQKRIDILTEKMKSAAKDPVVISVLIKEYLSIGDYKNADTAYYKYKDQLSDEENVILSTEMDIKKNKLVSASNKLEQFATTNPNSTKVMIKLAQVKKLLGLYSESAEIYLDLKKKIKSSDYTLELCEIYTLDSHHKDAERNCLNAAQKHPENPLPNTYLGISYREREMFKEARTQFEESLKKRPTEFALTCLGELSYMNKDKQKSIEYLNQAIEKNKYSHRAQLGLAIALFQEKQYDVALTHFGEACRLGKKDTLEMRKSHKILEDQKSPLATKYYDEIQKCKARSLF